MRLQNPGARALVFLFTASALIGCGDDHDHDEHDHSDLTDMSDASDPSDASDSADAVYPIGSYAFESRFEEGVSSVKYTGQIARHVLINEVKTQIGAVDPATTTYVPGQVFAVLNGVYQHDWSVVPELPFASLSGNDLQTNLDEISTNKKLINKMAGNDSPGWTQDWAGWATEMPDGTGGAAVPPSPDAFAQAMFHKLDELAVMHSEGNPPLDIAGNAITKAFVDADGIDWQQMAQKFLLGAVAFSQGTNDYLYKVAGIPGDDGQIDDSTAKPNATSDAGAPYSEMEHYWDEAFGYFGAAADYHLYTDAEISGKGGRDAWQGFHDTNGDGKIDLTSEFNFGHSQNAAKRDYGSAGIEGGVEYDMTGDVFGAFVAGRTFISSIDGDLNAEQLVELRGYIAMIKEGWEKAIAATVIHYINDTLGDMAKLGTEEYDFYAHAKHWGELKGFALGLQFNPDSPLHAVLEAYCETPEQGIDASITTAEGCIDAESTTGGGVWNPEESGFARFHRKLGDAPVFANGLEEQGNYRAIRTLLQNAYGFDATTVADW